jgi:hypothetical protein
VRARAFGAVSRVIFVGADNLAASDPADGDLGSAVLTVDSSVVNVALRAIERDLGGGLAAQQWVSNAYLLTLSSFILIGGSLGDIDGERRIFSVGIGAFGVVSLLCALAPTIGVLIAARAQQGAGRLGSPCEVVGDQRRRQDKREDGCEEEKYAQDGDERRCGADALVLGPVQIANVAFDGADRST